VIGCAIGNRKRVPAGMMPAALRRAN